VVAGDIVVVSYEGKVADCTVFDSALSFEFTIGTGEVIKGKGTRKLEITSSLCYGKCGSPPEIPPNAELFFTVTLKKIK
jgi:FKBP-type peptidyl-prolyl cis-trans isomerase